MYRTVHDFKVAGGLVLLVLAVMELTGTGRGFAAQDDSFGVVPLGVPLIAGPALLTTIIILISHYGILPTVAGLVLNMAIVWACLLWAPRMITLLVWLFPDVNRKKTRATNRHPMREVNAIRTNARNKTRETPRKDKKSVPARDTAASNEAIETLIISSTTYKFFRPS